MTAPRLVPAGRADTVVAADGARLAVTVCGPPLGPIAGPVLGPTVVLAHCWTGAREVWAPVAHRLVAAGHRVVLYDQRGHGSSTVGTAGVTLEALGDDLAAIVAATDPAGGDVVLAGHSMGGMSIQSFAARHPEVMAARVVGIALVATTAAGLSRGRMFDGLAARAIGAASVERRLRGRGGRLLVRPTVGRGAGRDPLDTTRELFVACPPAVRVALLRAMQAMDLRHALVGFAGPVHIVAGAADRLTPLPLARQMAAAWPTATLQVLARRGHMLPLEAPDEVAATIAGLARPGAAVEPTVGSVVGPR